MTKLCLVLLDSRMVIFNSRIMCMCVITDRKCDEKIKKQKCQQNETKRDYLILMKTTTTTTIFAIFSPIKETRNVERKKLSSRYIMIIFFTIIMFDCLLIIFFCNPLNHNLDI